MSARTGIVYDMPNDDYHAPRDEVSSGMLSAMNKSPAHCWALYFDPMRPETKVTEAMNRGTLAHTAILEPHTMRQRYVLRPPDVDYRTKAGREWRDSQTAAVISLDEWTDADNMRDAFHKVKALRQLLASGHAEVSIFWTDKATGLRCRARPDWLHFTSPQSVVCMDVKTIADLTPESVQRAVGAYGYHRQAAHYIKGLRALGLHVEEFVFGFVSSSYPFVAAAYVLDEETVQQAADEVDELMTRFAECKARNEWPAFGDGYILTGLPAWAKRSSEVEVSWET